MSRVSNILNAAQAFKNLPNSELRDVSVPDMVDTINFFIEREKIDPELRYICLSRSCFFQYFGTVSVLD